MSKENREDNKVQTTGFETREGRRDYEIYVASVVVGALGSGINEL